MNLGKMAVVIFHILLTFINFLSFKVFLMYVSAVITMRVCPVYECGFQINFHYRRTAAI